MKTETLKHPRSRNLKKRGIPNVSLEQESEDLRFYNRTTMICNHRFTLGLIRSFIWEERLPVRRGTYRHRQPHILRLFQDVDSPG